ncbi:tyrosine-type recombinase/integrase [Nonomuraea fuscirosea]|uniref:tyrosine-type recombinase/integrase n=1 Tax=Nonomuraea fuscirosea TaxID=1291556 RepID=UPI0033CE16CD
MEYLRSTGHSPNTVRSYAKGLELWWTFLEQRDQQWDAIGVAEVGTFLGQLRRAAVDVAAVPVDAGKAPADATIAVRVRSVMSFYRYHAGTGVAVADQLDETVKSGPARYLPFLEHIARRDGRRRNRVRVRVRRREIPVLMPEQAAALRDGEARWDPQHGNWAGELRYRLLWSLLEETGLRLGEALGLQHRDWKTGTGDTAVIEVVGRETHPHGVRAKSGYRRVHIGSELDRLYGEWVWALCEAGADVKVTDWDGLYIFCNLHHGRRFGPLRPESVYKHLAVMKRRVAGLPAQMTPHWFRHTHATALLLAGTPMHVVSRRLGHADVQTTINTYAYVTEDAELQACADWQVITRAWGGAR